MLKGIDVNQRIEFVSKFDSEPKTIFVFQPISGIGMIELGGKSIVDILDKAIVEVKNFQPEQPKIDILKSLSISVVTELIEEATKINNITSQDAKN